VSLLLEALRTHTPLPPQRPAPDAIEMRLSAIRIAQQCLARAALTLGRETVSLGEADGWVEDAVVALHQGVRQ